MLDLKLILYFYGVVSSSEPGALIPCPKSQQISLAYPLPLTFCEAACQSLSASGAYLT